MLTRRVFVTMAASAAMMRPALAEGAGISTGKNGVAIKGYDTRAYWSVGAPRTGEQAYVVTWQGVPWRFASQREADLFAAEPAKFAPAFGGFCTRAMSLKKVVDGDPEVWSIFENRLYLFARPVGLRHFKKGEIAMIESAQAHWDTLG